MQTFSINTLSYVEVLNTNGVLLYTVSFSSLSSLINEASKLPNVNVVDGNTGELFLLKVNGKAEYIAPEYEGFNSERGQGIVVLALFAMLLLAGVLVVWFVVTCITNPSQIKDILDSVKYFIDSIKSLVSGI